MCAYIDGLVMHGHRPDILVITSSEDVAKRNRIKAALIDSHRKHKLDVLFSSKREHEKYLSKVDSPSLRYAVSGDSPGALVNMGMLATIGRSALFIDADTRFEMSTPAIADAPPIYRKYDLIGKMSANGAAFSRSGTWGASCSDTGGCFYKSGDCDPPPFIPDAGWAQGIPWFLLSKYAPGCTTSDIPLAVRQMGIPSGLGSKYIPLVSPVINSVGPGGMSKAAEDLALHSDEFGPEINKYIDLLSSWGETISHAESLHEQGVRIGYKP
jgi:hypothetical protein